MVVDTGGGEYSTITDRAWHVLSNTNHSSLMSGHQSGHEQVLSVVNAVTKAYIEGRDEPVLFVMHYATPVVDKNEKESLHVPFQSMRHGIKFDLTPKTHGGKYNMTIEQEDFPIKFDGEKIFFNIDKTYSRGTRSLRLLRTYIGSRNEQNVGTKGSPEEQENNS